MELVWISYFNTLIVIIVALKFLHLIYNYYVKKILIIKSSNAASSKKEFVKKHINVFNKGAILFMTIYFFISFMMVYNHIMDLPNVINKKTKVINVMSNSNDTHNDIIKERSIEFIDINTNKKINLRLISPPIEKGECMKLAYYPHIKIALIISKNNCANNLEKKEIS